MGSSSTTDIESQLVRLKRQLKDMTAWNRRLKLELRRTQHKLDVLKTRVGEPNCSKG